MNVLRILPQGFAANCYLITADGKNAVAIDPAVPQVLEEATRRGLFVHTVLLTHGHFDHVGGCAALREAGAEVGCLEGEKPLAETHNLASELGGIQNFPPVHIDFTFRDGEVLERFGMRISVMGTPGHTAGSCCYLADTALFSGDTLFLEGYGRTDLPTGNRRALFESIRRLLRMEGDLLIYPGHGEATTLAHERAFWGGAV